MIIRTQEQIETDKRRINWYNEDKELYLLRKRPGGADYFLKVKFVYTEKIYKKNNYMIFTGETMSDITKLKIVDNKSGYYNKYRNFIEVDTCYICETVEVTDTVEVRRLVNKGKAIII